MAKKNPKVINTKNNIIGNASWIGNNRYLVKEIDGGYFVFHEDNLQDITNVDVRDIKITSDRQHAVLYINHRPVFENLKEVVQERFDRVQLFLLEHY